jgi:hypothetical protein
MQDVERLDFSKPPSAYEIHWEAADDEDPEGQGEWSWRLVVDDGTTIGTLPEEESEYPWTRVDCVAAAWLHHKTHNDPPGMWTSEDAFGVPPVDGLGCALRRDLTSKVEARAAAWAWHDRRVALIDEMNDVTACPNCYSRDAYTEAIDATTSTQPWCVECDVEMGGLGLSDDEWLAWPDELVIAGGRWLADPNADMPEVLR